MRHQAATFSRLHSSHPQYTDFLASSLGHTISVHKKHYQIPLGVLQKLNVYPVLHDLMTDKGNTTNNNDNCETTTTHNIDNCETTTTLTNDQEESDDSSDSENCSITTPQKKKHKWSCAEQNKILEQFSTQILKKIPPKRKDVVNFRNENLEMYQHLSIDQMYMFVRNHANRQQKNVTPKIKRILSKRSLTF